MSETYDQMIARIKSMKNSQPSEKPKTKPLVQPQEEDEEDENEEYKVESNIQNEDQSIKDHIKTNNEASAKNKPVVTKSTEEMSEEQKIVMQIELLQNDGRFRAELLFQLSEINKNLNGLASILVNMYGTK